MDLDAAREVFETSQDLTVGIEEEWALVDPQTARAVPRFEDLRSGAGERPRAGRRGGRRADLLGDRDPLRPRRGPRRTRAALQREARRRLFALADAHGVALAATGTHPLSDYREQHIIDTEHYHRVEEGLKYVAWRNNTFALQVHVGVRGADRAIQACDRLRPILPVLLAISANSPFIDGRDSGLHSGRTQIVHQVVPALRRPGRVRLLGGPGATTSTCCCARGSIVEFTQLWWSVRPHHAYGTIEVRICDAQTTGPEADGLAGADRGLRRAGAARDRRGRAAPGHPRPADRGEHVAGAALRAGRPPARPGGAGSRSTPRARRSTACRPGPAPTSPSPRSTAPSASGG